ncbi:MAG: diaminopimelate epimerase [Clostridia bacterium]|nr:diaminopimelate epimerase [Clostridia bacterium]
MQFFKMHALGNDFAVFGSPSQTKPLLPEQIEFICDRHYGIGADCAVFIGSSDDADYAMHVYNPNGFEAEMCGNALRCSAQYVSQNGFFKRKRLSAETLSAIHSIEITDEGITTEIGKATVIDKGRIELAGKVFPFASVSVGNPHCVIFAKPLSDAEFLFYGAVAEKHPYFPNGTNVEFATVTANDKIKMRVWERGIGETFSCSTGSCACVAAAHEADLCSGTAEVSQRGGVIKVETKENGSMFITGSCTTVFKGIINL